MRNGIVYKRLTFQDSPPSSSGTVMLYFRCDKKGTIFQCDKALSEKVGCPLVRYELVPSKNIPNAPSEEIEFVSDHLTAEELKVFAAWERNAKESPVRK